MANIKQQKKRALTDAKIRLANRMFKSKMRTVYKKASLAIDNKSDNAKELFQESIKLLDKALKKKLKKANFINRKKSQISKRFNTVNQK